MIKNTLFCATTLPQDAYIRKNQRLKTNGTGFFDGF